MSQTSPIQFKVGDKVRYYSTYWGTWKYCTIEKVDEVGLIWGKWTREGDKIPTYATNVNQKKYTVELLESSTAIYEDDPESWI